MSTAITVFVCGTFEDLSDERTAVIDVIRRLQLRHDSMEFFGARHERPIETCLAEVRKSDMLVVLVGHRYGTFVPGDDVSFSEAEYNEGSRLGKPCLVYERDETVPVLPKYVEQDSRKGRLLQQWKERMNLRHTAAKFRHSGDLAVQVESDLDLTLRNLDHPGPAAEAIRLLPHQIRHRDTLEQFQRDGSYEESVLLLTKVPDPSNPDGRRLSQIIDAIRTTVAAHGKRIRLPWDKVFYPSLHDQRELCRLGCGSAIAILEDRYRPELLSVVTYDLGWLVAMGKRVLLLRERDSLDDRTQLLGALFYDFSWHGRDGEIEDTVARWLTSLDQA